MIKDIEIKSIEDISQILLDQTYNEKIGRLRSKYYYRGLPDASFELMTGLKRNCGDKKNELEPAILRYFTKYAIMEEPSLGSSVWQQMIVGQHHGLPTRLLDWTYSPIVALHFADTENNLESMDKRDCVVWRMDIRDMNKNLPEKYLKELDKYSTSVFSVEMLTKLVDNIEEYDMDMGSQAMAIIEPPSVDQRIINQYSFFSVVPSGIDNIESYLEKYTDNTVRYLIRREVRWDLRDLLDQYNMNERMIYPGLDGLTRWLARHYYVKKR